MYTQRFKKSGYHCEGPDNKDYRILWFTFGSPSHGDYHPHMHTHTYIYICVYTHADSYTQRDQWMVECKLLFLSGLSQP